MALPKQHRLRSPRDFSKVHRQGLRAATQHLALRALKFQKIDRQKIDQIAQTAQRDRDKGKGAGGESSALSSCFGISISRKVSKRAVVRNRIKRQLLAIIQRNLAAIEPGWKIVIVVRPAAVECDFDDFLRELEYLLKKVKITEAFHGN